MKVRHFYVQSSGKDKFYTRIINGIDERGNDDDPGFFFTVNQRLLSAKANNSEL